MGILAEVEQYDDTIYQIETIDPILGGADGIANAAAKSLANRTKWLKAQIDSLSSNFSNITLPDFSLFVLKSNLPDFSTFVKNEDLNNINVGIGVGQSWQNVSNQRNADVVYYNQTSKPIVVSITIRCTSSTRHDAILKVDGRIISANVMNSPPDVGATVSAIVPVGSSYIFTSMWVYETINWLELS